MTEAAGLFSERSAWRGADLAADPTWVFTLDERQLAELRRCAAALPADPQAWLAIAPDDLYAPHLKATFGEIARELEFGRGTALVKGIPVDGPLAETYRLYWILGALLGPPVAHNGRGDVFGQVTDLGSQYISDPFARGYTSTDEMVFHNDAGDASGLLCLRSAKAGGESGLLSTMTLYREAKATGDPELMAALYRGFRIVIRDDQGPDAKRRVTDRRTPVFREWEGRLSGAVNLKSVGVVPQVTGQPFDAGEAKAFEFLSRTAEREELRFNLRLEPGDLLLMHNLVVLHKRTAFVDHPEPERKRLLLRLWLALHNGRALPPEMAPLRRGFAADPVINAVTDRSVELQGGER